MKKPEKETFLGDYQEIQSYVAGKCEGRNQTIDEYEKFLPSKQEIKEELLKAKKKHEDLGMWVPLFSYLAKAISKRLGK